jgi:AcrR family transcriptional regulator
VPSAAKQRTPKQERGLRTRAALVSAAQLEFSQRGYEATTARSIAERAGTATGSFYQYFPDKDAALRELWTTRVSAVRAAAAAWFSEPHAGVEADADYVRARLQMMVKLVIALHREDPGLHSVVTQRMQVDRQLDAITRESSRELVVQIASLLRSWSFSGDAMARAFVIHSLVEGAVHSHVLGEPMVSDRRFETDLVDALTALALGGASSLRSTGPEPSKKASPARSPSRSKRRGSML